MDLVQSELRRYNEEDLLEYDNDPMDGGGHTGVTTLF